MARVQFRISQDLDFPARVVFDELVDWRGHAEWVPLTRVRIEAGEGGVGTVFVATSGIGPLALPDRMRVDALDHEAMTVRITKIGPVLTGVVDLKVMPVDEQRCRLDWYEDIVVPVLPRFLAAPVAAAATQAFKSSIGRMARRLRAPR